LKREHRPAELNQTKKGDNMVPKDRDIADHSRKKRALNQTGNLPRRLWTRGQKENDFSKGITRKRLSPEKSVQEAVDT